ncbi:DUF6388 family protein [Pseudomonas chlororaphis]|uniref:Uncharacterized protein n=1 Tax=Pseudomonas chlororaphis TaxID=587753 RepID=A0A1Q8ES48_9PSED|nr:DUF6388 family protein [Pseudomonas chlororaphis]OLF54600.1 hypothetical protein BTN82_11400 [Pseudomonas chlororaphis]
MSLNEDRNALALEIFIDQRCDVRRWLAGLPAAQRSAAAQQAFDEAAAAQGLAPWELSLQLLARSPEELRAWRLEAHREIADFATMAWSEYCALNRLDE